MAKKSVKDGIDALMNLTKKNASARIYKATDVDKQYRYIDFMDLTLNRPCLPLEYVFGTRGLMTGKIIKYEARESDGKSSSIFMNYGMAQRSGGAYIVHMESEEAPPPPEFMWHLGCDPDEVIIEHPADVESCLKNAMNWINDVRKKVDPEMEHPIMVGIDSVSGLSARDTTNLDKEAGDASIGAHARAFSQWFREYTKHLATKQVVLMVSGQLKANIKIASFGESKTPGKNKSMVTIAEAPIAYHATWVIELHHTRHWIEGKGDLGETITIKCTKNKQGIRGRQAKVNLLAPQHTPSGKPGWDWDEAHKDLFFTNPATRKLCWPQDEAVSAGGWYRHKDIRGNKNLRWEDFLNEVYANQDILMSLRNNLRIRGFGLPFETSYKLSPSPEVEEEEEDDEDAKDS